MDGKRDKSQQCALTAQKVNRILVFWATSKEAHEVERGNLICTGETSHGVLCPDIEAVQLGEEKDSGRPDSGLSVSKGKL